MPLDLSLQLNDANTFPFKYFVTAITILSQRARGGLINKDAVNERPLTKTYAHKKKQLISNVHWKKIRTIVGRQCLAYLSGMKIAD